MEMNVLKYMAFVKTVESGSFTRASELLHYFQSGISRMISDLEREWSLTLLERGRGGVRLTSDGMKMLPYARSLCEEYEKMQGQVRDLHGLQSGILRIGTISSVATHWLPRIIKAFQGDYPRIEYELLLGDYEEIEEWIEEGRVDCRFVRLPTRDSFETIRIHEDRLMAVLPEDHPLAALEKVPLAEMCRDPFMLLERGAQAEVSELFQRNGLSPRVNFTTWDDYVVMSMVEQGLGISILPELILQRIPYRIAIRELDLPAVRELVLAMRGKGALSLAVRRFLEYLDFRRDR